MARKAPLSGGGANSLVMMTRSTTQTTRRTTKKTKKNDKEDKIDIKKDTKKNDKEDESEDEVIPASPKKPRPVRLVKRKYTDYSNELFLQLPLYY